MNTRSLKSRLLATSIISGLTVSTFGLKLMAQEQSDDEEARQEKVVVTGSRIVKRDYFSNSPILTIGSGTIEATGTVNVEELINIMPQALPNLSRTSNNPGNGTALLDLRGLGSARTLVLIDGKRFVLSGEQATDVNNIPPSLIERVEIITGGASAVYGSDAMAGVVNFILRDDFQGIEYRSGYEATFAYGDAEYYDLGFTFGANIEDGRGNIIIDMGHTDRKAVLQGARSFSAVTLGDGPNGLVRSGSANIPAGGVIAPFDFTALGIVPVTGTGTSASCNYDRYAYISLRSPSRLDAAKFDDTPSCRGFYGMFGGRDGFRPFVLGGDNTDRFNYGPYNYLQLPQERYYAFAKAEYRVSDSMDAYGRFALATNEVAQELAPAPAYQQVTTNITNPLLSPLARRAFKQVDDAAGIARYRSDWNAVYNVALTAAQQADPSSDLNSTDAATKLAAELAFISSFKASPPDNLPDPNDARYQGDGSVSVTTLKRLLEIKSRFKSDDRFVAQFTVGLSGAINDRFNYDVFLQYGNYLNNTVQIGNIDRARYLQGLNARADTSDSSRAVCVDSSGGCVPIDIWGVEEMSPEAIDYILVSNNIKEESGEVLIAGYFNGDTLGIFETSGGPIGWAFGIEYRESTYELAPDQILRRSNVIGFNSIGYTAGGFDVYDLYSEFSIPIVGGQPWAHHLELELAVRFSDYSTVDSTENYKIGGSWAPNEQIRFRSLLNTAIRVPTNRELYEPIVNGYPAATDPCDDDYIDDLDRPDAFKTGLQTFCVATGVPSQAGDNYSYSQLNTQIESLFGGNPNLDPEESETLTFGFVYEPSAIDGLVITVDYYDIKIEQEISRMAGGASGVLAECYLNNESFSLDNIFCAVIDRRVLGGGQPQISLQLQNLALTKLTGADLNIDFPFEIDSLPGGFNLDYIGNYVEAFESQTYEGSEVFDAAGSFNTFRTIPTYKHSVTVSWLVEDLSMHLNWNYISSADYPGSALVDSIDAYGTFGLSAIWDVNEQVRLRGGIRNLADVEPPLLGGNQQQANTLPGSYDVFGRTFYFSTRITF